VLSGLFIFFGVRSYRENVAGGRIRFGRAFAVGLLIALVASVCYVVIWEVLYFGVMPGLGDKIATCMVDQARAAGASAAQLEETARQMAQMKRNLDNPLINAAMAFAEPFPVGLLITLISAAVLRKK
jgi:hypothetical protein